MRLYFVLIIAIVILSVSVVPAEASLMDEIYQLTDRKQYGVALEKLNQFLKSNPNDAQARFLKGLVLTERGQQDEAIDIFKKLSNDYPDLPEPYNNLAVLYAEKGNYDLARNALTKAIKTHPTYATAHENLGDIYAKMASKSYRKALSLSGANQSIKAKLDYIKKVFVAHSSPTNEYQEKAPAAPPAIVDKPAVMEPPAESYTPPAAVTQRQTFSPVQDDLYNVEAAVEEWARAWSGRDVEGYLGAYSKKFRVPAKFPNFAAWERNRRRVIGKAGTIKVTYKDLRVKLLDRDLARAEFKQFYWSPTYKDQVNKTISFGRESGGWKILWERSEDKVQ